MPREWHIRITAHPPQYDATKRRHIARKPRVFRGGLDAHVDMGALLLFYFCSYIP
jgi:hypothetical protein